MARFLVLTTLMFSTSVQAKQMICSGVDENGSSIKVEISYEYENLPATELNIYLEDEKKYSLIKVREDSARLRGQGDQIVNNEVISASITTNEWALLRYPSENKGLSQTKSKFTLNTKSQFIDDVVLSCELLK